MKGFFLGVIVTLLLITVGGFFYLQMGLAEVRGDEPPSLVEDYLMRTAIHAAVRRNAPEMKSPVPPTNVNLITGAKQYLGECAGCHGTPGKQRKFPPGLNPAPPQFATVGTEYTEAQIVWVAKHGIRRTGMFSNGLWDADEELWAMAGYIKRMNNLPQEVKDELARAQKSGN